jgi:uncharacterized membrane protein YfcA
MTPIDQLLVVVISLAAGTIGAILGLGGGFIIVPMLVLIFGLPAQTASGTSLVALVFTALSGTLGYTWQRRIDYRLGLSLAIASAPGAVVGSLAATYVSSSVVTILFGCFMILVSIYIAVSPSASPSSNRHDGRPRQQVDRDGKKFEYAVKHVVFAYPLVFVAGVLAGFFGVGGGVLQVPVMILLLGVPIEIATATSALMILVSAVTGALTHGYLGDIAYEFTPFIIISVIFGAQLGVQIQRRAGPRTLRRLFALFVAIVGLRMVLAIML